MPGPIAPKTVPAKTKVKAAAKSAAKMKNPELRGRVKSAAKKATAKKK